MPAEGRSPDPIQARKGPTAPVIDDESTNTARKAEKVQTSPQTKVKAEPVACRLEMLREESGGALSPRTPPAADCRTAWDNEALGSAKARTRVDRHEASTTSQGGASIGRERRPDGSGESRMRYVAPVDMWRSAPQAAARAEWRLLNAT